MKFINSKLARVLLSVPLVRFQKGLRYIFVYHDVSNADSTLHHPMISTQVDVFEKQILWLKKQFKIVSLSDLVDDNTTDLNHAAVVFDDGFKSVLLNAQPILRREEIPFTIFINKNAVAQNWLWGSNVFMAHKTSDEKYLRKVYDYFSFDSLPYESFKQSPAEFLISKNKLRNDYNIFFDEKYTASDIYLNTSDLHQMLEAGCHIGSHTANHKLLALCDDATLNEEISSNAEFIEQLTGHPTDHFAIPFGFDGTFDMRAIELARRYHSRIYSTERTYFRRAPSVIPRLGLRNEPVMELKQVVNLPVAVGLRNKLLTL